MDLPDQRQRADLPPPMPEPVDGRGDGDTCSACGHGAEDSVRLRDPFDYFARLWSRLRGRSVGSKRHMIGCGFDPGYPASTCGCRDGYHERAVARRSI